MTHGEKKIAKIIEELTMFFFTIGAEHIESGITREGRQVTITFNADYLPECGHHLQSLEDCLNEPQNEGIEDFYWELAGSGDPGETSQLLLVGMMIDRAELEVSQDKVYLKLYKELEE